MVDRVLFSVSREKRNLIKGELLKKIG